jgi:hypothetical protein
VILAILLASGVARAQPAGDPTPGSPAPLVVVVNPMNGAVVGDRIRVEARVHHPSGLAAVSAVSLSISGAGGATVPLARNPSYALPAGAGIYEALVPLQQGTHTLVATATDSAGRSTRSPAVTVATSPGRGDGNLLVTDNSSQLCAACHAEADHGSEALGRAHGAWTTTCRDCHTPHQTVNASLIREAIVPPWLAGDAPSPPRLVRFSTRAGFAAQGGVARPAEASLANGDGSGPCQACHMRTTHWRGDGAADPNHSGRCTFCHSHGSAFAPKACTDCHPVPPSTGAHAAHHGASAPEPPFPNDPRPLGCGSCHPIDPARHGDGVRQVQLNPALVLPGGTRTTGASLSGSPSSPSCLVACHFPMGSPRPAAPIAWSATGPLPCRSCHARIDPYGVPPTPRAGPSLHDPIFSEARPASGEPTTCHSCHDAASHDATHLTGAPGLVASAGVNAVCIACHSPPSGPAAGPQGQVLHAGTNASTSKTPPILPGWSEATIDAGSGDFHGGRRGTCFGALGPEPCAPTVTPTGHGGTLKAPYVRGQAALPCAACHAGHVSGNSFLFADSVNGTAIPAGTIDRTGVGAERLCEACHEGGRHDRCKECHTDTYYCDENAQCWMDGAATHIDPAPAGSACFFCHGHEGIRRWTSPYGPHGQAPTNCQHCHGGMGANGGRPPTSVPPRLTLPTMPYGPPSVASVTSTGATISWRTDVPSSTTVEYGFGMPGYVTGSTAEVWDHSVTLSGLTPGTTYVWRLRSVDAYRNVLKTSLATFRTTAADAVPFPDVVPVGWTGVTQPETSMVVGLTWYPVASPTGNPVEYRVQLASDAGFLTLVNGSPSDSAWIPGSLGTLGGREVRVFGASLWNLPQDWCAEEVPYAEYWWRVKARDSVTGVESDWSVVDGFRATSNDPWGC